MWYGIRTCLLSITVLTVTLLGGCNLYRHSKEATQNEPLTAPQKLEIEGLILEIKSSLGYDYMPASPIPPVGLSMFAELSEINTQPISERFRILELWVVKNGKPFKYAVNDSNIRSIEPSCISVCLASGTAYQINYSGSYLGGGKADVIIKVESINQNTIFFLRSPDVQIKISW